MTTYLMNVEGDTLKVNFNQDNRTTGDILVKDAVARLDELINSGQLRGGYLLKINGPISLLISYAFAHKLADLYGAIAVSDTRLNAYVVVISNSPKYKIGDRLDFDNGEITTIPDKAPQACFLYVNNDTFFIGILHQNADGDQIVRETATQLEQLINFGLLKGKLLKIRGATGSIPILTSFVIGAKLAHLYGAIAVFDPKLGDQELDEYVITITHHPNYQIGDKISIKTQAQSLLKIALIGPPNTGKTCLREGLRKALSQYQNLDYYIISGCPDGDGAWHSETFQNHPELAKQLKEEYKAKFTPEFAKLKARDIEVIKNQLLIFDVGGQITEDNKIIMKQATHAIILVRKGDKKALKEWQDFCQELNRPVIAIIESELDGKEDKIENDIFPNFIGTVHNLKRGEDVSNRPTIQKLAKLLSNEILKQSPNVLE